MLSKTSIGIIIVLSTAIIMFIALIKGRDTYFNLREVVCKHIRIFESCPFQYVVFYVIPLLFSIGLAMIYEADVAFYTELSVIIGILLSMLFAILSILSGYDFSKVKDMQQRKKAEFVVDQTINAIVFDSMLCVFLMLYGLSVVVLHGANLSWLPFDIVIVKATISGFAYYVFSVILLTLLLIMKHMSRIIEFSFKAPKE